MFLAIYVDSKNGFTRACSRRVGNGSPTSKYSSVVNQGAAAPMSFHFHPHVRFRVSACLQSSHVHDHLGGVFYVLRAPRYF
jgi:hypothetical protein